MTLGTAINLLAGHIVTGDLKMITVFFFFSLLSVKDVNAGFYRQKTLPKVMKKLM